LVLGGKAPALSLRCADDGIDPPGAVIEAIVHARSERFGEKDVVVGAQGNPGPARRANDEVGSVAERGAGGRGGIAIGAYGRDKVYATTTRSEAVPVESEGEHRVTGHPPIRLEAEGTTALVSPGLRYPVGLQVRRAERSAGGRAAGIP